MDLGLYREVERILAVAISGMSIYLGYRLFLDVKAVQDSAGKLRLPGGIAIYHFVFRGNNLLFFPSKRFKFKPR
jgi:hypothetical protein